MSKRGICFICACLLFGPCPPVAIGLFIYAVLAGKHLDER